MKNTKILVYIAAVLAMLFWGYSFVWYKIAYLYYKPITVVFLRLIISSLLLMAYIKLSGKVERIEKKDLLLFILMAFCEPFCYFLGESFGMFYISSTTGAIIIATIPLFSPLLAHRFLNEKINFPLILGLFTSFIGVFLIVQGDYKGTDSIKGIALMFFAVFSAVCYGVILKKMSHKYTPFTIVKFQSVFGVIFFLPLFLIWDLKHFISIDHQLSGVWIIFQMALFASTLSFLLISYAIKHLGLSRTNIFANLIPVFTAVISFYILKERFPLIKIAGMVIVISGLIISEVGRINIIFKIK